MGHRTINSLKNWKKMANFVPKISKISKNCWKTWIFADFSQCFGNIWLESGLYYIVTLANNIKTVGNAYNWQKPQFWVSASTKRCFSFVTQSGKFRGKCNFWRKKCGWTTFYVSKQLSNIFLISFDKLEI